jgi:S1-C subfamily serine protease
VLRHLRLPIALLAIAASVAEAGSLSSTTIRRVTSACVLIHVSEGRQGAAGSGFFVSRSDILTNYHVVKTAVVGDAQVRIVIQGGGDTQKLASADVVAYDEDTDLALLRTEAKAPYTLRFLPERQIKTTMPIWVAGFPFGTQLGLAIKLVDGTVSAPIRDEEGNLVQVQLNANVNPGNSGGPVVDSTGRVVGISRATIDPTKGHGIGLAIPSVVAEEFYKEAQRVKRRTSRLRLSGKSTRDGLRVVGVEKTEEPWGTSVRLTLRGSRGAEDAMPFVVEITDRRRDVIKRDAVLVEGLRNREESSYTIRLRGTDFKDVSSCRIVD